MVVHTAFSTRSHPDTVNYPWEPAANGTSLSMGTSQARELLALIIKFLCGLSFIQIPQMPLLRLGQLFRMCTIHQSATWLH